MTYLNTSLSDLFDQRHHLFAYWPCCFALGIAAYFMLHSEPFWGISFGLLLVISFAFIIFKDKIHNCAPIYYVSHALLAVVLGFCIASMRTAYLNTSFITEICKNITITATVLNVERTKGTDHRFTLGAIEHSKLTKVQLKGKPGLQLEPGWRVRCIVTLLPLTGAVSPVAYDFKRAHYFSGIGASGRIKSCVVLDKPRSTIDNIRFSITESFRAKLSEPFGDIAAALVTGDRSGIPKDLRQQFTDAGLAHVLAISGLHLGLVAGLIFFVAKRLLMLCYFIRPNAPVREISACITIASMALYLAISGFGYPAIRSFGMTALLMLGVIYNRNPLSMRSVALAASLILVLYPESLFSASFQLSFAAVIALIATYESVWLYVKNWLHAEIDPNWYRKVIVYFGAIFLTTFVATLATTPLSMAIFNRLTLQAVLGNLFAIPLIGFWVMPLIVVSTLSLLFGGWSFALFLTERGLNVLVSIAQYVSNLPGSGLVIPTPSDLFYPSFVIGGLLLCIGPWKKIRFCGLLLACISFVFFKNSNLPIAYFSGDRSVMAVKDGSNFYVSNLERGSFFYDQWRQHLGIEVANVKRMPAQDITIAGRYFIVDPFKSAIDLSLKERPQKKRYIKAIERLKFNSFVYTNSFFKGEARVNGELLTQKGSAFLYADGTLLFQSDLAHQRPWK
ncbi:MAG: ComEC/Rec2 family competence protein [Candidatus Paracaedibacteraceae bacterium]|nr:ComEC/Rec2 family competence protein [Candidatus Paracaedibacteraceae bacterium]